MKFKIHLQDPDGVYDSLEDAAKNSVEQVTGLNEDEKEEVIETRREELEESSCLWIKRGEYVTIEIDTDAKTARVCRVGE